MAEKTNYQEELKERVTRLCYDVGVEPERVQTVFEFVKQESLKSWKNGINEGLKRVTGKPPKAAPVYANGSALQNGKLKPVEAAPASKH